MHDARLEKPIGIYATNAKAAWMWQNAHGQALGCPMFVENPKRSLQKVSFNVCEVTIIRLMFVWRADMACCENLSERDAIMETIVS